MGEESEWLTFENGGYYCDACPNGTSRLRVKKDTLIADASWPHRRGLDNGGGYCLIEDCPDYDASLLPAGD